MLSESFLGSNAVKKRLVCTQIPYSPSCMLLAHGKVMGSVNEAYEGVPEFVRQGSMQTVTNKTYAVLIL